MRAGSFDAPRQRAAPTVLVGEGPAGEKRRVEVTRPTLVVAVKPNCDGCRDFIGSDLSALAALELVLVARARDDEWADARREVWTAPDLMDALLMTSPPFYVLIDPTSRGVVAEGVVFDVEQVASEISAYLTD